MATAKNTPINRKKKLSDKSAVYLLFCLTVIQLMAVIEMNLTKSYDFLDYDSSLQIRHGWEIWKHGLFLKDWVYFSTLDTDCAGFLGAGLYILTGKFNISMTVSHLFSYLMMFFVIFDLMKNLETERALEKTFLSVIVIYTPYSFGQLEWANMIFASTGAYEYRVLLMLWLIDIFVICERKRTAGYKFFILNLIGILLNGWVSLSTGNYVLFMILGPIILKLFCDVIDQKKIRFRDTVYWVMLVHIVVSVGCWKLRNHFAGASHRNNLTIISNSDFFTNIQNCLTGIFALFGGIPVNSDIWLFSVKGVAVVIRFFFTLFCLLYVGYHLFSKDHKEDRNRFTGYVQCYLFVHLFLLLLTKTSYGMIFEYRYHILWCVLMFMYAVIHVFQISQYKNDWWRSCILAGLAVGIVIINVTGFRVFLSEVKENEFLNTTIQAVRETGSDSVYFFNLPNYAHMLRAVKSDIYCANVNLREDGIPQVTGVGDFYAYYPDRSQAGDRNLLICTSEEFEKMPDYMKKSYVQQKPAGWGYYIYLSATNIWDGCSGMPYPSVDTSMDFPFSGGYAYSGEIGDDGMTVLNKEAQGYVLTGPATQSVSGTYEICLSYQITSEEPGTAFLEVSADQGQTILAKETLNKDAGEVTLSEIEVADGQKIQVRLWKDKNMEIEVEKIIYSRKQLRE